MYLDGFIVRIYHDAQSHERQILRYNLSQRQSCFTQTQYDGTNIEKFELSDSVLSLRAL
jgi:hypothetical protein